MNLKRVRTLKGGPARQGPVVYWMSRDQRVADNWALVYAQDVASRQRTPLAVMFCLVPEFLGATTRQYSFMLKGLREVEKSLSKKNIPFFLVAGAPGKEIPAFLKRYKAGTLVKDFDPLRIKREWTDSVEENIDMPFYEVDAHNIVPCWVASAKQEYGAYTLRPKIHRLLTEFLEEFPKIRKHPFPSQAKPLPVDWEKALHTSNVDTVTEVKWLAPGEDASRNVLKDFIRNKLENYDQQRNDPQRDGQSNLSPYLHFGQISAQRIALEVMRNYSDKKSGEAFLEELIVRKELSDNFCFYNKNYDNTEGFPEWARKTLHEHRNDKRPYMYSRDQFENAGTHDELWNAAQVEMVKKGKMHGYMRMYWAKKILEWSEAPERAVEIAISSQ